MSKSKYALILLLLSILIACSVIYGVIDDGGRLVLDQTISTFITTIFPEQTRSFFKIIEIFGSTMGIATVGIATMLWLGLKKKNYIGMVTVLIAVGLGNEVNGLIKDSIKRPRPELEHLSDAEGFGFPSGHVMVGIILYIILAYFIFKEVKSSLAKWLVGMTFALIMLLVGVSRIVLQVHYPSGVIGGFTLGYIWVYFMIVAYEGLMKTRNIEKSTSIPGDV